MPQTDEIESFAVPGAVADTLQRYVDGARTGDIARLRPAFAEGARVSGSDGGKPVTWSLQEFCEAVAIDAAGGAAMARLEALDWRGTRYTDFFVMIRRDDGWQIDNKVFHAHARA